MKERKILSILLILTIAFTLNTNTFASSAKIAPLSIVASDWGTDWVFLEPVPVRGGQSHSFTSYGQGFYLAAGETYSIVIDASTESGSIVRVPFNLSVRGTWADGRSGYYANNADAKECRGDSHGGGWHAELKITPPYDMYATFTVLNRSLSTYNFSGDLISLSY